MRRTGAAAIVGATMFVAPNAFAEQDDEVETLVKQLREEHAALATQDCATACKALASIRRASDRICALEPGPRCTDARTKADDAQRRVQAACPDCQIAAAPPNDDERRAAGSPPRTASGKSAAVDERKGGCASCNTPGHRPTGDIGLVMLAALAIARRLRARSRSVR